MKHPPGCPCNGCYGDEDELNPCTRTSCKEFLDWRSTRRAKRIESEKKLDLCRFK